MIRHGALWLQLVLLVGLTARLTYLIVEDRILLVPREKILAKTHLTGSYINYALQCRWCIGFWMAVIVAILWLFFPAVTLIAGLIGTLSYVTGLLGEHHGD
jgi:hypothetical protein